MTVSRKNLSRLLDPQSIALVGGADAGIAAKQCAELFDGRTYAVNPRRDTLGGLPCYPSVTALPEAPDAVFLATPRAATVENLSALAKMGAGGVACFTAGYAELGETGKAAERELIAACGDMALVGPNCYGLINYSSRAILWPFGAGHQRCQRGVALIMQSGMLPANLTMNDRSVPISFVVSAGNQAVLAIEDYVDILVEDDRVTAIGMYIEGIKDLGRFSAAAVKALAANKPIVVLKAGRSEGGAALAISHTGSLSGSDQAFDALFRDYGVIRVDSPVVLVETLKLLSVSGAPRGKRVAAFTCSGGDAAMVADYSASAGLDLVSPDAGSAEKLQQLLPDIATISNPLDYTTPLWGNRETMPRVFGAMFETGFDAAVVIQDFPPPHIHADNSHYRNDALSFAEAVNAAGIPGAVCSDLPENMDRETREILIERNVTPLQGLDAGLDAIALACDYGEQCGDMNAERLPAPLSPRLLDYDACDLEVLSEQEGKQCLQQWGIDVPRHRVVDTVDAVEAARWIGFPVVVKAVVEGLAHKTELNAVQLNLQSNEAVVDAIDKIAKSLGSSPGSIALEQVLVEEMLSEPLVELLVGITSDPQFGKLLVIASGGIFVELFADATTLLLPTSHQRVLHSLQRLKAWQLLTGYRGRPACDINRLADSIVAIANAALNDDRLVELDINPLMVSDDRVVAADVLIRRISKGTQ